ncbi:MAG: alpha/beta fold hydrolase [Roseibium sp.]
MSDLPGLVLVHGAWHSSETWSDVKPLLEAKGFDVTAVDLPGAGLNARAPVAYHNRPLDAAAFGTEPSPNAGVGQQERTDAVVAAVRASAERTGNKVVLVGHSLGGITISPVAEAVPELLHSVIYLTAFLLAPGVPAIAMIQDPTMAEALVPTLFMADPQNVGALRVDTGSDDAEYLAKVKAAFYGDLSDAQFKSAKTGLHPDEPVQVAVVPSPITAEHFGSVPRHYIRCANDQAITLAGQDKMIADTDAALGSKTAVHTLQTSHSPFFSQPEKLAELINGIADN